MDTAPAAPAWHASYPNPVSAAVYLPRVKVLEFLEQKPAAAGKVFLLVDLRRTDYEGGTITCSLNLPAQTLYPSLPTLYTLASTAGVEYVIFYCGSSAGRGSREAAWFADYIDRKQDKRMKSVALEGGIKGWVAEGGRCLEFMEGFVESFWRK